MQQEADVRTGLADPYADLLRASFPMIDILRGDKRAWFRACWMKAAHGLAMNTLNMQNRTFPQGRRAIALALFNASLDLLQAEGWSRAELVEFFNDKGEAGDFLRKPKCGEAIDTLFAMLLELAAQRQLAIARACDDAGAEL